MDLDFKGVHLYKYPKDNVLSLVYDFERKIESTRVHKCSSSCNLTTSCFGMIYINSCVYLQSMSSLDLC